MSSKDFGSLFFLAIFIADGKNENSTCKTVNSFPLKPKYMRQVLNMPGEHAVVDALRTNG